jgi:hypothetical protein
VIVVTDTSVVLNLCCIQCEHLVSELFGTIVAPPSVVMEFQRLAKTDARFSKLNFPDFIQIATPSRVLPVLSGNEKLHSGEIDALSLAVEVHADAVLMDERAGRETASTLGLQCVGILGILIEAKERELLSAVGPLLDQLQVTAGFWIATPLRKRVLNIVNE